MKIEIFKEKFQLPDNYALIQSGGKIFFYTK